MNLYASKNEPCMFYSKDFDVDLIVVIYVDDILIASQSEELIVQTKMELEKEFILKDFGPVKYCLGLEINQTQDMVSISQTGYIKTLLRRFGMEKCNPVSTPAEVGNTLITKESSDKILSTTRGYRELIGALLYLAVATRVDIAHTVARLAQFTNAPEKQHWIAAKRLLRYLQATSNLGLVFRKNGKSVIGYSDADWGNCPIDRKSYSGYVFLMGGSAVSWKSQKQRTTALSSTEAEYISLSEATKEAIYLRRLLLELGFENAAKISMHVDNRGAECLANDPVYHSRTKHIDIRYHFIRDVVSRGEINIEHVSTHDMVADILTKALPRQLHYEFCDKIGLAFL